MAMITGMARPILGMASGIPFTQNINDYYQKNGEEEGETVLLSER